MAITAVIMFIIAILSQMIQGFGSWFGLETETGGFGKMAISIIFWIMVNFAMLSVPNNWYFHNLWVPVVVTALLLAFMLKGWYNNEVPKWAPETFIIIFIGFLMFSGYMNWEAGKIRLPGWLQNKANEVRKVKEVDGQMLLARFVQSSVGYEYDKKTRKYNPQPTIKFRPGSVVRVTKPNIPPDSSQGESMLLVQQQNKYGEFLGDWIYVPARKLEYLSPSKLKEIKKQRLANQPDTVAVITGVNVTWYPPAYSREDIYWVVVPPKTLAKFVDNTGRWKMPFDNRANARKRVYKWIPFSPAETLYKLEPRTAELIILKKKNKTT